MGGTIYWRNNFAELYYFFICYFQLIKNIYFDKNTITVIYFQNNVGCLMFIHYFQCFADAHWIQTKTRCNNREHATSRQRRLLRNFFW